ncbi:MAG: DUF512 domain-containing protein [Clostridia bacterium]|nr:DUF512 domain-containing protein [Clostridia bacterium]
MLKIKEVAKNSIGEELGLKKGDEVLAFDGHTAVDVLDYLYYDEKESFTLTVRQTNGDESSCEIEKEEDESLGLTFESDNLDIRTCHNHCIFCFIDQMPCGMRDTLYVKDDDYRQSFLCGNFVTLTNLKEEDEERIARLRLSPLYVSVHTMNGELRKQMTGNRFADRIGLQLKKFADAGITMHTQIVLARGYNDGKELEFSARELFSLYPNVQTMAVVPVGMTKFRDGLTKIQDIDQDYAKEIISFAKNLNEEFGENFIQLADEFYFRAGLDVEPYEFYGSFPQIENGVGTTAKFLKEIDENIKTSKFKKKILLISGTSAGDFIKNQADKVQKAVKGLEVKVLSVKNDFFGETVNCTGLLTGQDILKAVLSEGEGYDIVVMPCHVLREKTDLFLDGMTVKELSKKTGKKIRITNGTGESFVKALSSRKFKEV